MPYLPGDGHRGYTIHMSANVIRNLVFEGGGVKGIGYAGALHVLERRGVLAGVDRVAGTSAGAITALLVGLGYSVAEIDAELKSLNFNSFLDDSWGVLRDTERLITEFGWYRGTAFKRWCGDRIKAKMGRAEATFTDAGAAGMKKMFFVGANLATHQAEVYSLETAPFMPLVDAVRISMSIPLFFTAVRGPGWHTRVDGGLLWNYPIQLFDHPRYYRRGEGLPGTDAWGPNTQTLGFKLDSRQEIDAVRKRQVARRPRAEDWGEPQLIADIFDYTRHLVGTIMDLQGALHLHSEDWRRTIYIDTLGVGTTEFDLKEERKQALIESGRKAAEAYFQASTQE